MRTSPSVNDERTFRSGPYLHQLFRAAERMDAQLQQDICARIKQARVEAGFTQEEAADTLGITQRAYQNYEANRVPFRTMSRIAEVFRVSEAWLLHGEAETRDDAKMDEVLAELADLKEMMRRFLEAQETRQVG